MKLPAEITRGVLAHAIVSSAKAAGASDVGAARAGEYAMAATLPTTASGAALLLREAVERSGLPIERAIAALRNAVSGLPASVEDLDESIALSAAFAALFPRKSFERCPECRGSGSTREMGLCGEPGGVIPCCNPRCVGGRVPA